MAAQIYLQTLRPRVPTHGNNATVRAYLVFNLPIRLTEVEAARLGSETSQSRIMEAIAMTPFERRDMPWLIGVAIALLIIMIIVSIATGMARSPLRTAISWQKGR